MKTEFVFPTTVKCRIIYTRDGTTYAALVPTPKSKDELVAVMLTRQVGISQVTKIEPVVSHVKPEGHHPAHRKVAQYTAMTQ